MPDKATRPLRRINAVYPGASRRLTPRSFDQWEITMPVARRCTACRGAGTCSDCSGKGGTQFCPGHHGGPHIDSCYWETCARCGGSAKCRVCGGSGVDEPV